MAAIPKAEVKPLMRLTEAASALGISRSTAYQLNAAGKFPIEVLKVGGTYHVRTAELRAYLKMAA